MPLIMPVFVPVFNSYNSIGYVYLSEFLGKSMPVFMPACELPAFSSCRMRRPTRISPTAHTLLVPAPVNDNLHLRQCRLEFAGIKIRKAGIHMTKLTRFAIAAICLNKRYRHPKAGAPIDR